MHSTILVGITVFLFFQGEGSYSILFLYIQKNGIAKIFGFVSFGLYTRWCYEEPILPNEQGIQLFFGAQTGEVWTESSFLFIPRPFWGIWKKISINHFSFTVVAQNRTKEGHSLMLFATGRAVPQNVQLLAKISEEDLKQQTVGISMSALGEYIRFNTRDSLLVYPSMDISSLVRKRFQKNRLYGLDVDVFTTKVVEVNQETMRQFDVLARQSDMDTILSKLKDTFPGATDLERYAMYASFVGVNPAVMSYIVHGEGKSNLLLGGQHHSR